uniref:Uncharacterized protein n=1 Tax=Fagus sylvatica TaxID=28930 RepID=A0A2N9G4I0_FAGSY
MWKRAGPPHHPVVHGELSSGPQQTQSPKKRSAAAPAAANDEGSDEEDEARLKRLRNLPWPPKSVPSEAGNDEKPSWVFSLSTGHGGPQHKPVHGSTSWDKNDNQGQKRLEKSAMATTTRRTTTTTAQHSGGPSSSTSWNLGSKVWR